MERNDIILLIPDKSVPDPVYNLNGQRTVDMDTLSWPFKILVEVCPHTGKIHSYSLEESFISTIKKSNASIKLLLIYLFGGRLHRAHNYNYNNNTQTPRT